MPASVIVCSEMAQLDFHSKDLVAILSNRTENAIQYKILCDRFSKETEDNILIELFSFLKGNIYLLDKDCEQFVAILLRIPWAKKENVSRLYIELILNLVSAHTYYLTSVLNMIISLFYANLDHDEHKTTEILNEDIKCFESAHALLKGIIKIVPLSPKLLIPTLVIRYPYITKRPYAHLCYAENIFKITLYLPEERRTLLELVVSKILDIDVNCPKSAIEEAENEDTLFPMEMNQSEQMNKKKFQMHNTLDFLMKKLFDYIDEICIKNEKIDWEGTKKLYKDFLMLFDKLILPTFACSHVQYFMFYICSLKWPLCEGFIDYLWKKIQNPNLPAVIKQIASCYIGSLISRANYISVNCVKDVLNVMSCWIHQYIDSQSGSNQKCINTVIHGTFYTICQMVFYIFTFRHKELIEMKDGLTYLRSLNFERMINCRLNPLKVCQSSVITNFASITRNYQIAYCYTIIERNNRNLIPENSQALCSLTQINSNIFYPFDPYMLKVSSERIIPLYRVYEQINIPVGEQENEDDDEFLVDSTSPSSMLPELLAYGSSSGFKKFIVENK